MSTTPTPISALPAAPDRADRATFSGRAVAMFTALKEVFVGEVNAIASVTKSNADEAAASAASAATAEYNANVSAANAATASGAPMWATGTTYALGAATWSPANRVIYRKITASSVSTVDPSADPTNWALLGTVGMSVANVPGTSVSASANGHYVLTNVAATTVTLPAGVSGATIAITTTGTLITNSVTPAGAETIMETSGAMTLDKTGVTVTLRFLNNSWRII